MSGARLRGRRGYAGARLQHRIGEAGCLSPKPSSSTLTPMRFAQVERRPREDLLSPAPGRPCRQPPAARHSGYQLLGACAAKPCRERAPTTQPTCDPPQEWCRTLKISPFWPDGCRGKQLASAVARSMAGESEVELTVPLSIGDHAARQSLVGRTRVSCFRHRKRFRRGCSRGGSAGQIERETIARPVASTGHRLSRLPAVTACCWRLRRYTSPERRIQGGAWIPPDTRRSQRRSPGQARSQPRRQRPAARTSCTRT